MNLFEHADFEQSILRAAQHFQARGLRPAIIEKDYYVTEALRILAGRGDSIIFKGGTSLAKGWNLIQRFSEDIDIFLDPESFQPVLGKNGIDRELKKLRDAVGKHPALTFVQGESQTVGGFGRNDRFSYRQIFGGAGEVANRVLIEAGTASGREPTATVELRSYLGQFCMRRTSPWGLTMRDRFRCACCIFGELLSRKCSRRPRLVLATGRYLGEGFDDDRLDTLLLAMPISWKGTLAQYAGRLNRVREGKQQVTIYDYADLEVPMLKRMFERRRRGYRQLGYEICNEQPGTTDEADSK